MAKYLRDNPTAGNIAPFVAFVAVLALEQAAGPTPSFWSPVRFGATLAAILFISWPYIQWRPSAPLASVGIGVAVFLIWIAPDRLFHYRHFWLFENSITGAASSSIPPA